MQNVEIKCDLGVKGHQGHRQCHHLIECIPYDFVFNFNRNYLSILYGYYYIHQVNGVNWQIYCDALILSVTSL